MKAFLSHSSANKDFVETVATQLGRQFCVFDKQSFQSGIEFKDSIEKGLNDSSLFVLFASPEALESIWVQFEIAEAFYGVVQKRLHRVLVVMLGDSVRVSQLPEWLRRAKAIAVSSPKQTAREIRLHLNELFRAEKHPLFIGRTTEIAQAEQELLSTQSGVPGRFLAFVGLPQIGRRSIARRVGQNVLGMQTTTELTVESGDDLRDIAFKLAVETEPYAGATSLAGIQNEIAGLSDEKAAERALRNLRAIVAAGSLPVFVDGGGLMNESGDFAESLEPLFVSLSQANDAYLFFVTSRKPTRTEPIGAPVVRIPPLPEREIHRLPHGVLFRGGAEERIRTKLLQDGHIDTVIGLPANLFYSTGIPVCILVLKKCKKPDDVLFINAAEHFVKGKRQNQLSAEHIAKIIETYQFRKEEERYSRRVEMAEIEKNDFNLNISRYISTAEEISLEENQVKMIGIEDTARAARAKHNEFLKELGLPELPWSK
jgi:N-6 DNA Methylase/TIR domain